jgi:hypothetical protein
VLAVVKGTIATWVGWWSRAEKFWFMELFMAQPQQVIAEEVGAKLVPAVVTG